MRLLLLACVVAMGCSLSIDTSDLSGGPPRKEDTGPCDKKACLPVGKVVPLTSIAPCTKETTDLVGCRKTIHDTCVALDSCCFEGGIGPVDFPNDTDATIICTSGTTYTVPLSEFPKCTPSNLATRECDAAVHASAPKRGLASAYFQTFDGTNATVIGYTTQEVFVQADMAWSDLADQDPGCSPATPSSQACSTAVHRFCATDGTDVSGYGPLTWDTTNVTFVCVF
ncbi:MAG: hypothetical protein ACXVEF_05640 [Polyangiales bacterium]